MPDKKPRPGVRSAARQEQFLEVITRDEATDRFRRQLALEPLGRETVPLALARQRVLASTIVSPVDVPAFDRSNVDGFALVAADTFGAMEERPRALALNAEVIEPGRVPPSRSPAGARRSSPPAACCRAGRTR
jgi:putative molybdopterin biosynthesis protein